MSLYRETATGFLGIFVKSPPGAGWELIPDGPGAPDWAVAEWWRKIDQRIKPEDDLVDWHPSLAPTSIATPKPSGLAGSGVNIFPARYSSWEDPDGIPPIFTDGVEVKLVATGFHGNWRLRITATEDDGYLIFAPAEDEYNIKLTPFRRWIVSAYFSSPVSATPFTWLMTRADANGGLTETQSWVSLTNEIGGQWIRRWTDIDLLNSTLVRANMGIRLAKTGDVIDIDAIMLEELLGDTVIPSAYADPPYIPKPNDPVIERAITAARSGGEANTYAREIAVGDSEFLLGLQLPAVDVAKEEKRGAILIHGVLTLKRKVEGLNFNGTLEFLRNGELVREQNFSAPSLRYASIPFVFSDFYRDPAETFLIIKITNIGGGRFILQDVDSWWLEQVL